MNKKIVIKNNVIFMFVCNILVFLLMLLFKKIYTKLNYWVVIKNIMIILNVTCLIVGIAFNVLYYMKKEKYDNKKSFIIPIVVFVILQLFNIVVVNLVNKAHDSSYFYMTNKISAFCLPYNYYCDSYEIFKDENYNDFVSYKTYYDYNKKKNNIEIHTKYKANSIISVEAYIYSNKASYSAFLLKNTVKKYFENFDYEVNEKYISEAFNKRFNGIVTDGNVTYKVEEIYNKKKELDKIKTIIKLEVEE